MGTNSDAFYSETFIISTITNNGNLKLNTNSSGIHYNKLVKFQQIMSNKFFFFKSRKIS